MDDARSDGLEEGVMWRRLLLAVVLLINGCAGEDVRDYRPDPRAPQAEGQHGNYG